MRRGFTLIELLVASGVFLFGFTAALGLFLIGTRARAQADGMLRLSLAASSIVEEIRLEAGREGTPNGTPVSTLTAPPYAPKDYIGDGFAAIVSGSDESTNDSLYQYPLQPGIWYRVLGCVDEKGDSLPSERRADLATALRIDLLVVWNPVPDQALTMDQLAQRQRIRRMSDWPEPTTTGPLSPAQMQYLADFMAKRGFAVRETAWIIRKPSWER